MLSKSLFFLFFAIAAVLNAHAEERDPAEIRAMAESCFDRAEYVCSMYQYHLLMEADNFADSRDKREAYIGVARSALLLSISDKFNSHPGDRIAELQWAATLLEAAYYEDSVLYLSINLQLAKQYANTCDSKIDFTISKMKIYWTGDIQLTDAAAYPGNILTLFEEAFSSIYDSDCD